ncbi:MAG: CAP domain-containing protein [Polyangiaceae bacterium]
MIIPRLVLGAVLVVALAACDRSSPTWTHGPSYPPGQPPPTAAPPPAAPLGAAWTPVGDLLQALPAVVAAWPPFPTELPTLFPSAPPPQGQPPATSWSQWEDEMLRLTNERRAVGAVCGGTPFAAAPPLAPQPQLWAAARAHASDMAQRDYFSHRSPEGGGPAERARAAGYASGFVGENIAAGQASPSEVVQAWIDSAGHCENLMSPRYRALGVGHVYDEADRYRHYWVQSFGG